MLTSSKKNSVDLTEPYLRDVLSEKSVPGADGAIESEKKHKAEVGGSEGSKEKKVMKPPIAADSELMCSVSHVPWCF